MKIQDSRLNATDIRRINGMAFKFIVHGGESFEAHMYERPNFVNTDSPSSKGYGDSKHDAMVDAYLNWATR